MKVLIVITSILSIILQLLAAEDAGKVATSTTSSSSSLSSVSSTGTTDDGIKAYKRLIPADVLRDFPGMCFASTRCATIEPGKSWDLTPFCGRSTCVIGENQQLLELVEDCGPLPLSNDKCKLDTEKTNKTASFPWCCPKFVCEDGIKLEYPDVKSEDTTNKPSELTN